MYEYDNIIEPFLAKVEEHPDRLACIYEDIELTYLDLAQLTDRIARVYRDRGIVAGDRVAYLMPNRPELIAVYLAIQQIGAVAVPLNFRLIPREIAYLVNSVGARMLVFDQNFIDRVRETKAEFAPELKLISVGKSTEFSDRLYDLEIIAPDPPVPLYKGGGPSRIQFTGGSTGIPKGAVRSHAADLTQMYSTSASNEMLAMEHPVALIQCPLEHHGGHSWFMSSLCAGATVVVCGKFDPNTIFSQIEKHQVTHMILLPPTTYLRLVRDGNPENYQLDSLRIIQSAAGGITPEIVNAIFETFPNADINYGWGQSESGVGTSMRMTREMYAANDPRLASVGTPMDTLQIKVVDDDFNELPCGEAGEAVVCGPTLMEGYYNQPDLTAAAMEQGWLHTGDIMTIDEEGFCYLKARKKDMIKSGGENVFVGEVQTAILRNPKVADCVVFGVRDALMGEAVAAVVQPVAGEELSVDEVQETCKEFIASYKKPRYIEFIDDMGRDDAGKVRMDTIKEYFNSKRAAAEGQAADAGE